MFPMAALFIFSWINTPKGAWGEIAAAMARSEREREQRSKIGPLWWVFHRLMNVFGWISFLFVLWMIAYNLLD